MGIWVYVHVMIGLVFLQPPLPLTLFFFNRVSSLNWRFTASFQMSRTTASRPLGVSQGAKRLGTARCLVVLLLHIQSLAPSAQGVQLHSPIVLSRTSTKPNLTEQPSYMPVFRMCPVMSCQGGMSLPRETWAVSLWCPVAIHPTTRDPRDTTRQDKVWAYPHHLSSSVALHECVLNLFPMSVPGHPGVFCYSSPFPSLVGISPDASASRSLQ